MAAKWVGWQPDLRPQIMSTLLAHERGKAGQKLEAGRLAEMVERGKFEREEKFPTQTRLAEERGRRTEQMGRERLESVEQMGRERRESVEQMGRERRESVEQRDKERIESSEYIAGERRRQGAAEFMVRTQQRDQESASKILMQISRKWSEMSEEERVKVSTSPLFKSLEQRAGMPGFLANLPVTTADVEEMGTGLGKLLMKEVESIPEPGAGWIERNITQYIWPETAEEVSKADLIPEQKKKAREAIFEELLKGRPELKKLLRPEKEKKPILTGLNLPKIVPVDMPEPNLPEGPFPGATSARMPEPGIPSGPLAGATPVDMPEPKFLGIVERAEKGDKEAIALLKAMGVIK